MRDMKDKLTVGGWKRLPEKIQNAFIELQLQLSTLREHSGGDDVAPMNKVTTRENYDKGVSQLPLLLFDREGHHPSRQWPEFWTVLQKSQNPRYQQNRQMDRASRAWMPDSC
ncbi:hypothetical protein SCP_0411350 [Sparassis crispa]|uniref:Uncharacterized protein n=1 Tax=Sparassis crispa TaxID=139825 RepID=A0A401GKS2_9APHY|nr:hypothetical protein SCP_0411350 [Sparassis crispa]GBE82750.1 hypothetical protein SCP_0411350 [Sparassis crispa]